MPSIKDLLKPVVSVQNAVLVLSLIFFLAILGLSSTELASWVQAIGSVAAIWFALSISQNQLAHQNLIKSEEVLARAEAFYAVEKSAVEHAGSVSEIIADGANIFAFKMVWDAQIGELFWAALNALKALPVHELGSYELVVAHTTILSSMMSMNKELDKLLANWEEGTDLSNIYASVVSQNRILQHMWVKYERAYADRIRRLD